MSSKNQGLNQSFKFILTLAKPYKLYLTGLLLIEIIWALYLSIYPYLIKVIIDRLEASKLSSDVYKQVLLPALIFITLSVMRVFIFRIGDYIYARSMPYIRKDTMLKCVEYAHRQSYSYFQRHFSGLIATKISETVDAVEDIIRSTFYKFLAHILTFCVACTTLYLTVHISISMFFITFLILFIGASYYFLHKPYVLARRYMGAYTSLIGKLVDSISNILSVLLFAQKKYEFKYIELQARREAKLSNKLKFTMLAVQSTASLLLAVMISVSLLYLLYLRQKGLVTIGDFALVLFITVNISESLENLGGDFLKFSESLGKCSETLSLITESGCVLDIPNAKPIQVTSGGIEFRDVSFAYDKGRTLFDCLSIKIPGLQKVGLVGYSGSGKTTFVNLILRLFDVGSGKILIDEQDIKLVTQDSLYKAISFVPQEPTLFNRTVYQNISYGSPGSSINAVKNAAKKAYADGFINSFQKKYQTVVGERGTKLSGGQRQRIAIARGILKNSKILILDEITSSLDPVHESHLQTNIKEVSRGKTVLAISHHIETLIEMDRILVFDKGSIVGDGSHAQLMQTSPIYQKIVEPSAYKHRLVNTTAEIKALCD